MSTFTTAVKNLSLKLGHKCSKLCKEECPEEKNGISVNSGSLIVCASPSQTQTLAPCLLSRMNCQMGFFCSTSTVRHQGTLCKSLWNNSAQKHSLAAKQTVKRKSGQVFLDSYLVSVTRIWRNQKGREMLPSLVITFQRNCARFFPQQTLSINICNLWPKRHGMQKVDKHIKESRVSTS